MLFTKTISVCKKVLFTIFVFSHVKIMFCVRYIHKIKTIQFLSMCKLLSMELCYLNLNDECKLKMCFSQSIKYAYSPLLLQTLELTVPIVDVCEATK